MTSVNERLEHLRRTQARRATPEDFESARLRLPPPTRRTAGPPAPRSWLDPVTYRSNALVIEGDFDNAVPPSTRRPALGTFPDIKLPDRRSLVHHTLKGLAADLDWHIEYDHEYLSELPTKLKPLLLSYIATYSQNGSPIIALRLLFDDIHTNDSDTLTHLDLGGALGRALSLKQLTQYWTRRPRDTSNHHSPVPVLPDSWDEDTPDTHSAPYSVSLTPTPTLRFPALTHLSLSHASSSTSWTELLHFSRHLTNLTFLSLAFWPAPSLPGTAASFSSSSSINPTTTATASDDAATDAAHLLSHLARTTPSLRILDLTGCQSWWRALRTTTPLGTPLPRTHKPRGALAHARAVAFDQTPTQPGAAPATIGVDWSTAWPRLATLLLRQNTLPPDIHATFFARALASRGRAPSASAPPAAHQRPGHDDLLGGLHALGLDASAYAPPAAPAAGGAWRNAGQERYRVASTSPAVLSSVAAVARRRAWCAAESEALLVEGWVRGRRRGATGVSRVGVEHGWGVAELLAAGYERAELEEAGLFVPYDEG